MKPMDSIDVSNRKPRRFKGTPSFKVRNWIAAAFVAYTLVTAGLYMIAPFNREVWTVFELLGEARKQELKETTPEETLKNNLMLQAYSTISQKKSQPDIVKETETRTGD